MKEYIELSVFDTAFDFSKLSDADWLLVKAEWKLSFPEEWKRLYPAQAERGDKGVSVTAHQWRKSSSPELQEHYSAMYKRAEATKEWKRVNTRSI